VKQLGAGDVGLVDLVQMQGTDMKFAMKTLDKWEMQERNKVRGAGRGSGGQGAPGRGRAWGGAARGAVGAAWCTCWGKGADPFPATLRM
jgi:hypothetical protein